MEERNYGINWLGLFIKIIIFVIIVLLAIWLISKLTFNSKGISFEENNQIFKDAAIEYFKKNLPQEGKNIKVTLNQLIEWDYIKELKNEKGKKCDIKNSNSKIELQEDYYSIKTVLVCDKESQTTYTKLGNEECTNCDVKVKDLTINKKTEEKPENNKDNNKENNNITTNSSNDTSNSVNIQNNTPTQVVLYEYVKQTTEYSDWYKGIVTGNNIENSKENVSYSKFCKNEEYTYRTVNYVTEKKSFSYTLELINLTNVNSLNIENTEYFKTYNDYVKYLENKYQDITMVGASNKKNKLPSASEIKKSSLDSNNFTFSISKPYETNNRYYVDINVNVKNLYGVTPYYLERKDAYIYHTPIEFTVSYINKNNCITDITDNIDKYKEYTIIDSWTETEDIYRYKITETEYKYSNQDSLEGYTKTGKTKLAS